MAEYLVQHVNYMKKLSFKDIEQADIDWNAFLIQGNFKDRILKHNPPLSREEF